MYTLKEIPEKNLLVFIALILIPLYLFKKSLFESFFNFSFYLVTTGMILTYYLLVLFSIKIRIFRYIAYFFIIPFLCLQFLLLYSFVFNKDYTYKDLTLENFRRPLILWLEKEIQSIQENKKEHYMPAKRDEIIYSDIQTPEDVILVKEEPRDEEDTWSEYDIEANRRKDYQVQDAQDTYEAYDSYQSNDSGYHYVDGYTRSDGTEVDGYVRGNPDGIEENNIDYMREHEDQDSPETFISTFFD